MFLMLVWTCCVTRQLNFVRTADVAAGVTTADDKNEGSRCWTLRIQEYDFAPLALEGRSVGRRHSRLTRLPDARRSRGPADKTVAGTVKISGHAQRRAAMLYLLAFRCAVLMRNRRRSHRPAGLVPVLREGLIESQGGLSVRTELFRHGHRLFQSRQSLHPHLREQFRNHPPDQQRERSSPGQA